MHGYVLGHVSRHTCRHALTTVAYKSVTPCKFRARHVSDACLEHAQRIPNPSSTYTPVSNAFLTHVHGPARRRFYCRLTHVYTHVCTHATHTCPRAMSTHMSACMPMRISTHKSAHIRTTCPHGILLQAERASPIRSSASRQKEAGQHKVTAFIWWRKVTAPIL